MPALPLAFVLYVALRGPAAVEPDVGQTLLITSCGRALFFLAGSRCWVMASSAACGALGVAVAYSTFEHVR